MSILLDYGHYLHPQEHDEIKKILLSPVTKGYVRVYPEKEFQKALDLIKSMREMLIRDLRELGEFSWKRGE